MDTFESMILFMLPFPDWWDLEGNHAKQPYLLILPTTVDGSEILHHLWCTKKPWK